MITVLLEPADNGLIKILQDDNANAAGETFESRRVYDFTGDLSQKNKVKFVKDLCLDLGIDLGTSMSKEQIQISIDWGQNYQPTKSEQDKKMKALEQELEKLRALNNK